jgi:hypothetical protein
VFWWEACCRVWNGLGKSADCKYGSSFVPLGFTHIRVIGYQGIIIYTESNDAFLYLHACIMFLVIFWDLWCDLGWENRHETIGTCLPNQAPYSVAQGRSTSAKYGLLTGEWQAVPSQLFINMSPPPQVLPAISAVSLPSVQHLRSSPVWPTPFRYAVPTPQPQSCGQHRPEFIKCNFERDSRARRARDR